MRRAWIVLLLAIAPPVALAHLDSTEPGDVQGTYELAVKRVDVIEKVGDGRPAGGWVYGLISAWVTSHDGSDPAKKHLVYGPVRFSPGPPDAKGFVRDSIAIGQVVYRHTDCTPPEEMKLESVAAIVRSRRAVPKRLRAPGGRPVRGAKVKEVLALIERGGDLPGFEVSPEMDASTATRIEGRAREGDFQVRIAGDGSYTETETPCGADPGPGTAPPPPLEFRDMGFEHPDPPAQSPPYSAVCGDLVFNSRLGPYEFSVQLQVETPGGWVDEGAPKKVTLDAGESATVRFGISVAERNYRLVATGPGDLAATSDPVDVGPGSPPRQTRDCHPPG